MVRPAVADRFKSWDPSTMPWDLSELQFDLTLHKGTKKLIDQVKKNLSQGDTAVIATDNDPTGEGQMIARNVLNYIHWSGPVERMYFEDEEPSSIQEAFRNRQELSNESNGDLEFQKALARSKWDFASMQFVRLMTEYAREEGFQAVLYNGRLKSVIINTVGGQEAARKAYVRKPYYEVAYKDEQGNVYKQTPPKGAEPDEINFRYENKADVPVSDYIERGTPVEDSRKQASKGPSKLLDLQNLTSILATKGHKPKDVIKTYQSMYEDGYVTYPRTEDKYITQAQFDVLKDSVSAIADLVGVDKSLLTHTRPRKTHVKSGMAHGANRPGKKVPKSLADLDRYGKSAQAIYMTLAQNSLAMFAEDYSYDRVKAYLKEDDRFTTTLTIPKDKGYKLVFDDRQLDDKASEEDDKSLGESADRFIRESAKPKPAKPTMKWLAKRLEKFNVGTGATRTSTISDLTGGKYPALREKRGALSLTEPGQVSYILLTDTYIGNPEMTDKLLTQMDSVGDGKLSADDVLMSITPIIEHDKERFIQNKQRLPKECGGFKMKKDEVEKVSGTFNGEEVTFKRVWGVNSDHPFRMSDEQVETLLDGEKIEFEKESQKGNLVTFIGRLAKQSYKGHEFFGLEAKPKFIYEKEGW